MLSRKKSAKHQIFKFKTHLEGRASVFTSVADVLQSKLTNSRQRADAQKSNTHSAWIVPAVTAFPCEESWMMLTSDWWQITQGCDYYAPERAFTGMRGGMLRRQVYTPRARRHIVVNDFMRLFEP